MKLTEVILVADPDAGLDVDVVVVDCEAVDVVVDDPADVVVVVVDDAEAVTTTVAYVGGSAEDTYGK